MVGIAASFLTWWMLFHWFVPKIEFSPFISKVPRSGGSGFSYRIKIINTGRRSILGVDVYARLVIDWQGKGTLSGLYLPFSSEGEKKFDIPILKRNGNRVLSLFINSVQSFQTNVKYPPTFKEKAIAKTVTMEDALALGKTAYIQVFVSGYDEFSGARRVFESPKYAVSDIYSNRFAKNGLGLGVESEASNATTLSATGEA